MASLRRWSQPRLDPLQTASGSDVLSYSAAAWALSAGSLVTVNVSASGRVLVLVLATVNLTTNATSSALIGVSVDGATPANAVAQFSLGPQGVGVSGTTKLVGVGIVTGLTPGSHTFQVGYNSVTANAINFLGPTTIVIPL